MRMNPMNQELYPWGGEFTVCSSEGCIAVVLLNTEYKPSSHVAIYGSLRTENIGIEKIVANIISNPKIRYLIIYGEEIRGHRCGASLAALYQHGIDQNNKIIKAPGAIPYIENLQQEAIQRFQKQITLVDLIDKYDSNQIDQTIQRLTQQNPGSFGKPYIALRIRPEKTVQIDDQRALHSKITIDYKGKIKRREI